MLTPGPRPSRPRLKAPLKELFVQVLAVCADRGLVDLTLVAIDGSPMDANASKDSNLTLPRLEATIARDQARVEELLWETFTCAQAADGMIEGETEQHPAPSTSTPRLGRLCDRLVRARDAQDKIYERALPSGDEIKVKVEAAERMVARARQRLAAVTATHQARLDNYAQRTQSDRAAGLRGAKGRPPVPIDAKTVIVAQRARLARHLDWLERARHPEPHPSAAARASLTDPDSRLMPCKRGGYLQGYNLQIACARNQVLLAIELQDNPADMTALVPMVHQARRNCAAAEITLEVGMWLADSGYASVENFQALAATPLLVSVANEGRLTGRADPPHIESVPAGQREMAARLATPEGKHLYKRRGALVEPGFAQLFQRFGRHLNYRTTDGVDADVDAEIKLLGTVHNLAKLLNAGPKARC